MSKKTLKRKYQTFKPTAIQKLPALAPVTVAEYLRRKNEHNKRKDPLATNIQERSVRNAIIGGYIEVVESCGKYLIDWERYKDFVFRTARRTASV